MTDMQCVSGVDLLMDYLEGTVSPEMRSAIEAHLDTCPRCVAFIKSYMEAPRILREATAGAMPEDLQESLRTYLKSHLKSPEH